MKISLEHILTLTSTGYHTLQVPEYSIEIGNNTNNSTKEILLNVPDDFFDTIKDGRLTIGKESGYLYLSEKGWNYFKKDIKKSFNPNRGSWVEFLDHVDKHFKNLKLQTKNKRNFYLTKAQQIEQELLKRGW